MNKEKLQKHIFYIVGILGLCALFALVIRLHSHVRITRDDFFYYPFAKHDFFYFLCCLGFHYFNTNGRLLVHSICALFLNGNLWIFRICNILFIAVAVLLAIKLISKEKTKQWWLFCIGFSLFWLAGNYVITESVLWISGAFNYVLPMLFLITYLYFLCNDCSRGRKKCAVLFGTLSAWTTEAIAVVTLLLTVIILLAKYKKPKNMSDWYKVGVVLQILGALFLLLAPGMHTRMPIETGFMQRFMHIGINLNTFLQMSFEQGGFGLILCFCMLSSGFYAYKILKNYFLAGNFVLLAVMSILTLCGVFYAAWLYIVISALCLVYLIRFSILLLRNRSYFVPLNVLCFVLFFGINCASGIVGYRMLFFPAMCLLLIGLWAMANAVSRTGVFCCVFICVACLSAYNLTAVSNTNAQNAAVWDENQRKIEAFTGGDTIELKNMPEESLFQNAVPVEICFADHYLSEFGIDAAVQSYTTEYIYYKVADENQKMVTDKAIKRNGVCYIHYEPLCEYLGTQAIWKYDTVEVHYKQKMYRFHYGAQSALTAYFGGSSVKLTHPIRSVDSWMYISLEDANRLFDIKLKETP